MITNNFYNLIKMQLAKTSTNKGLLPVTAVDGVTYYLSNAITTASFPYAATNSFALVAANAGVSIGTGSTAATVNDYQLEATITSDVWQTCMLDTGLDGDGKAYVAYELIVKNTGETNLTIAEVGYKQPLYAATAQGGTSSAVRVCLLDRTVLDTPLVLAPGEFGEITYKLRTV